MGRFLAPTPTPTHALSIWQEDLSPGDTAAQGHLPPQLSTVGEMAALAAPEARYPWRCAHGW